MGMTLTEKILAKAAARSAVEPGENIWVDVDLLMTHDVCGPGTIGVFKREFGADAKVWDSEKIVLIPDHYIFTADERANRNVDILRDFAKEQGIKYFYDITDRADFKANPDYKGVCHIALAQEGHTRPGEVLFGTDSHTCNAGAFGQFATGIGNTDAGFIMGTGKLLIKVPATMRFVMDGEMPDYLLAQDLILQIIGDIGVAGATYRTMEFAGSTIQQLTMEERMTLCNMAIEAGGKNGTIAADETTFEYVRARTNKPFEPVYTDADAQFYSDRHYDVSQLEPVKVPTYLVPATQKVYEDMFTLKYEGQTLSEIFLQAGCIEPAAPSCAACLGGPKDTFGRMNEPEVCVSTTNRNFPGRMGDKTAQIYLASPYTAAASALTGYVTDPREFLS